MVESSCGGDSCHDNVTDCHIGLVELAGGARGRSVTISALRSEDISLLMAAVGAAVTTRPVRLIGGTCWLIDSGDKHVDSYQ